MRGPSLTYASVTKSSSTSTSVKRFSQLAMAERRTFSTAGAIFLFAARRMLMACPARWPRIRSTTNRAFCGDVLMYLASALASMSVPLCRLGGLFGRGLGGMTLEGPRGRKLAELVPNHVLGDVYRNELPAVVNGDGVPDEIGNNGGTPRPGTNHFLFVLLVQRRDLLEEMVVGERSFFERSAHVRLISISF